MWHPKKNLDPFLPVLSHFFMSYFNVLGSIFEKCAMTDLPNIIVSMCLVSYNFCMIPQVCTLTFGLNPWNNGYSGAVLVCTSSTTPGLQIHKCDHTRTANVTSPTKHQTAKYIGITSPTFLGGYWQTAGSIVIICVRVVGSVKWTW